MPNRLRGAVYSLLCLLLSAFPASAQTAARASLSIPNTDGLPRITAYLDIHDSQGSFVHGLQPDQIRVLENAFPLPVTQLQELCAGVQFVVAINPGSTFGIRNNQAISRYDRLKDALRNWANSRLGSNIDDWSLLITNGPSISHVTDPHEWLATLEKDQVDPRLAIPNLDTLFHAVNLAADQPVRPGMGRTVLFISPPPEGESNQTLENLSAQARGQKISINIWMVASDSDFITQSGKQLMDLAESTGGKFFIFTVEETLPNPEEYLEPLRYIYHLEYQSNVKSSDTHQLAVQIQMGAEQIVTETQSFEINIQPPMPAFISPPIQILLRPATERNEMDFNLAQFTESGDMAAKAKNPPGVFTPGEQALQVVFDFPDGRKRSIAQTSLFVDGVLVTQNSQPPFDQFIWPLDGYTKDGIHNIQVQAKDTLGLTGSSVEIPVKIIIERPRSSPWTPIQRNLPILSVLAALLAVAFLFLVLVVGKKLLPSTLRVSRKRTRKPDPVTHPIQIRTEASSRRLPGWVNRLQFSERRGAPKACAYLSCISDSDEPTTAPPIPITSNEISFGTGVGQVTLVLDDPSIEVLHARLRQEEDGSFRLFDEGSTAGTWVNYTPISKEGTKLEHGDLIHIGPIGFRFILRQPSKTRRLLITPEETPEEPPEESDS